MIVQKQLRVFLWVLVFPWIPLSVYPKGGDGGGFNGPDESTWIIPESVDYGVSLAELDGVARGCLAKTYQQVRYTLHGELDSALAPVCRTSPQAERNSGRSGEFPGYLDVSCASSDMQSFPVTAVATQSNRVRVRHARGSETSNIWMLEARSGFPFIRYRSLETVSRRTHSGTQAFEQVQGLTFEVDPNFDEQGQAIEISRQFAPPIDPETPIRINGRSYSDCVQAEIQKTPFDAPTSVVPLPLELCPELDPWVRELQALPPFATTPGWRSDRLQREWHSRRVVIHRLYEQYEQGAFDLERIEACLTSPDLESSKTDFFETLYFEFYERTLARLRHARSSGLRRFVDLTDRTYRDNRRRPLFRLTGHFDQNSPGSPFAGVHRASGSIYMDLSQIPRDEWYVIFIHEMAHKLDAQLAQATRDYSLNLGLLSEFELWAQRPSLSDLPPEVREDLDLWLISGLHRGLWAEYRAWYITFILYQEGVQEGLWKAIPRFETVLAGRPPAVNFALYLYDHLVERAKMPNTGVYSSPIVREAIQQLLGQFRASDRTPELGSLGRILGE
jgi:hypothetical protein